MKAVHLDRFPERLGFREPLCGQRDRFGTFFVTKHVVANVYEVTCKKCLQLFVARRSPEVEVA